MAQKGHCSRRDAEKLISAGKVKVNGEIIDSPVCFVSESDKIEIDGKRLEQQCGGDVRLWGYAHSLM